MKKIVYNINLFLLFVALISCNFSIASENTKKNYSGIQSSSFSSFNYEKKFLTEEIYSDFIKDHIFVQPEFKYASAIQNEKNLLLRSANRERFPSISGRVINDEVLDRKVNDFNSIRKRQDDSFDAVAEINQAIYSGGRINSQIRYAKHESNNSIIEKNFTTSRLIMEANSTFISAMIYDYIYRYSLNLINELLPLKDKMEKRVKSGAIDPAQHAVFLARLNKFQSSIYNLEARAKTTQANYENTFNKKFIFQGFPRIPILINDNIQLKESFNLSLKENKYLSSLETIKITKSDYRPQFGIRARYTEYDIDKSEDDSDIRGGLYLTMPLFDFGRGRAKIQASEARAYAAKVDIDVERKGNKVTENEIIAIIESSVKAIDKLKEAFKDTKIQRKIIRERILLTGFSPMSLVETAESELSQLQILLETENLLIINFYELLHHNQLLINHFKLAL
ncbi:TolC family protein [Hyphomicrobiales bacterium]|nr:TolC family protein [Hyphomicrobiales bacterium]